MFIMNNLIGNCKTLHPTAHRMLAHGLLNHTTVLKGFIVQNTLTSGIKIGLHGKPESSEDLTSL